MRDNFVNNLKIKQGLKNFTKSTKGNLYICSMEELVNKVAQSGLISVDLMDYCPKESAFMGFDFAPALWNGFVLKEKEFREFVKNHDWHSYAGKIAYLYCSVDAILPSWAFMLVSSKLIGIADSIQVGSLQEARQKELEKAILSLDITEFTDGKLIVKGCSAIPKPESAMSLFLQRVQSICSSVMYGEPCSTVPVYKKSKK